jgi:hypothetical protein
LHIDPFRRVVGPTNLFNVLSSEYMHEMSYLLEYKNSWLPFRYAPVHMSCAHTCYSSWESKAYLVPKLPEHNKIYVVLCMVCSELQIHFGYEKGQGPT